MIVVAGNPRSGTSIMMRCFVEALGADRIIGDKFPQERSRKEYLERIAKEPARRFELLKYIFDKSPDNSDETMAKVKDMNPNGFWECPFTVRGVRWAANDRAAELIAKVESEDSKKPYVVKLVNSGLRATRGNYVDKVVYMRRHPRDIAKSQERLKRSSKFTLSDGAVVDLYEGVVINDPVFYLTSTRQFAEWCESNKGIPMLQVDYDKLIDTPADTLREIGAFVGEDLIGASSVINPKLRRSKVRDGDTDELWTQAEDVHSALIREDWGGIMEIVDDPKGACSKRHSTWICPRLRATVAYGNCVSCIKGDEGMIRGGISRADANGWDWRVEPCAFECGMDPDRDTYINLLESVARNHWIPFAG